LKRSIKGFISQFERDLPILLEILPDGIAYDDEPHIGEEFGCLLPGEILLKVGKKKVKIEKGQSFYYIANKAHA